MSTHQSAMSKLHRWHQRPVGLAAFAAAELVAFCIVVSRALDTGSFWYYALSLGLLIGGVHNVIRLLMRLAPKKK